MSRSNYKTGTAVSVAPTALRFWFRGLGFGASGSGLRADSEKCQARDRTVLETIACLSILVLHQFIGVGV